MIYKVPKHYAGLDHSGPCKVLPPTFGGIRQLVDRVGEEAAKASFITPPDPDNASTDLVRDFLQELTYSDKVERQTLIRDFSSFVKDLQEKGSKPALAAAAAGAASAAGAAGAAVVPKAAATPAAAAAATPASESAGAGERSDTA